MRTTHSTAIAGVLLSIAGCSTAPMQQQPREPAPPASQIPVASVPARAPESSAAPTPRPAPAGEATPEGVAPAVAVTPAARPEVDAPAPVAKRAPLARPVAAKPVVAQPAPTSASKPEPKPAPEPEVAAVGSITGVLKLVAGPGQSVSAGEVSEGLVYFLPKAGSPKPKPGRYSINTRSKGFIPETLVVPQGSTVRFPNVDTIIHNVYSRSPGNSFDLGYYGPGKSPEYTFNTAGLAIVNCTVHHTMRANVVVLATPYYTRPGKDGSYQIKDVPPGPGTLVFWHPRAVAKSLQASVPLAAGAVQTLVASKSPQMH